MVHYHRSLRLDLVHLNNISAAPLGAVVFLASKYWKCYENQRRTFRSGHRAPTISAEKDKVYDVLLISCRQRWLLLSQRCELKSPHNKNAAVVISFHPKSLSTPVYLVDVVIVTYESCVFRILPHRGILIKPDLVRHHSVSMQLR